jgi:GNAT superfamily N-acetyltransferase
VAEAVTIRDARPDDAAAFVRAYERSWDAALSGIAGKRLGELASVEERTMSFRKGVESISADARILVAERDGTVVGIATCRREGRTCELRGLYVVPEAWGSGVARDLMDAALEAMRARGASDAFLWVVEANGRARRFYEREGWTADGETRASELGPPEVRYRRSLDP